MNTTALRKAPTVVKRHPTTALVPCVVLGIMLGLGLWAINKAAQQTIASAKAEAAVQGAEFQRTVMGYLQTSLGAVTFVTLRVQRRASWPALKQYVDNSISDMGLPQLLAVSIAPLGIVNGTYPSRTAKWGLPVGTDLLDADNKLHTFTRPLVTDGGYVLFGPLTTPGDPYTQRLIFITAVNVSGSHLAEFEVSNMSSFISSGECACTQNSTSGTSFWGLLYVVINTTAFATGPDSPLTRLGQRYDYRMSRAPVIALNETSRVVYFQSRRPPTDPVIISTKELGYEVEISHIGGWTPGWMPGATAGLVIGAIIIACLVFGMLLMWRISQLVLESVIPMNVLKEMRKDKGISLKPAKAKTGSPSDMIIEMLDTLLDGQTPAVTDVITIRTVVRERFNIYQPFGFKQQLFDKLEGDVAESLLRVLGNNGSSASGSDNHQLRRSMPLLDDGKPCVDDLAADDLRGALMYVMADNFEPSGHDSNPHSYGRLSMLSMSNRSVTGAAPTIGAGPWSHNSDCFIEPRTGANNKSRRNSVTLSDGPISGSGSHKDLRSLTGVLMQQRLNSGTGGVPPPAVASAASGTQRLRAPPMVVCAPLMTEVERILSFAENWEFDAWALDEATQGHGLSTLGYYLFHKQGIIHDLKIRGVVLARFLRAVEGLYLDNPYHNKTHAADVLQSFSQLLLKGGVLFGMPRTHTLLACYLAAMVHDLGHVGKTNDFLVNTKNPLALRYNDVAPLENHHASAAFMLLQEPDLNFLNVLDETEQRSLRKTVIELVLATDMKQHFETVTQFNSAYGVAPRTDPLGPLPPPSGSPSSYQVSILARSASGNIVRSKSEQMLALKMALKCSDLGHLSSELSVHLKWVAALEEEFFRQGDAEAAAGLPISPLFDRSKPGVTKSQVGFFDFIALPCHSTLVQAFPDAQMMWLNLQSNYCYWQDRAARPTSESSAKH